MFAKATGGDPSELGRKDVDEFRAAIEPLADAGKLGALLAQFPASFKNEPDIARLPRVAAGAFREYPRRRRAAPSQLERRAGRDRCSCSRSSSAALGADRRAEVPVLDPAEPAAERQDASTTCGCTAATPRSGGSTRSRRTATTTSTRAEELEPFAEAAKAASREVKKAYLYANNHFSAKSVANAAILKTQLGQELTASIPRSSSRLPGPEGAGEAAAGAAAAHSFTEAFLRMSAFCSFSTTSMPVVTRPKTVYLPSRPGRGWHDDVELAVGELGIARRAPSPPSPARAGASW